MKKVNTAIKMTIIRVSEKEIVVRLIEWGNTMKRAKSTSPDTVTEVTAKGNLFRPDAVLTPHEMKVFNSFSWSQGDLMGPWGVYAVYKAMFFQHGLIADFESETVDGMGIQHTFQYTEDALRVTQTTDMSEMFIANAQKLRQHSGSFNASKKELIQPQSSLSIPTESVNNYGVVVETPFMRRLQAIGKCTRTTIYTEEKRSTTFDRGDSIQESAIATVLKEQMSASSETMGIIETIVDIHNQTSSTPMFFYEFGKDLNRLLALTTTQMVHSQLTFKNESVSITVPAWQLYCLTQHLADNNPTEERLPYLGMLFCCWIVHPEILEQQLVSFAEFTETQAGTAVVDRKHAESSAAAEHTEPDIRLTIQKLAFRYNCYCRLQQERPQLLASEEGESRRALSHSPAASIESKREEIVQSIFEECQRFARIERNKCQLYMQIVELPHEIRDRMTGLLQSTDQSIRELTLLESCLHDSDFVIGEICADLFGIAKGNINSLTMTVRNIPDLLKIKITQYLNDRGMGTAPEWHAIQACMYGESLCAQITKTTLSRETDTIALTLMETAAIHCTFEFKDDLCSAFNNVLTLLEEPSKLVSLGLFHASISEDLLRNMKILALNPQSRPVAQLLHQRIIKILSPRRAARNYQKQMGKLLEDGDNAAESQFGSRS